MKYRYSSHSLEQLQRRQINKIIVDEVLNDPDKIEVLEKCTKVFQKKFVDNKKTYLYRVFVNICKDPQIGHYSI
jgi:SOS response regulatory protein OraA/RecX